MTYGERFRQLRLKIRPDERVIDLAAKLGKGYPSTVYNIETRFLPPNLKTIATHARALGCQPWELLEGVETEYDLVRAMAKLPPHVAQQRWRALVRRATETRRGTNARERGQ